MEVDEILRKAWEAVEKSGVPEALHEVAFREAVETLRGWGGDSTAVAAEGGTRSVRGGATRDGRRKAPKPSTDMAATIPDEDTFFSRLANESGVKEQDLRDILQLTAEGTVHVTPPTKNLGTSTSQQARTVIALVASARSIGLGERPVGADAVRREAERKRCYDPTNFAGAHLRPMKGFNAGSNRNEIVLTSKWVDEFTAAVDQAHGRKPDSDKD